MSRRGIALLYGGLFALVAGLVLVYETKWGGGPRPRLPVHNGRLSHRDVIAMLIAGSAIGALGVGGWAWLRRRGRRPERLARVVLAGAVLFSGFTYFYARQGLMTSSFVHRWDAMHYLLAPRYYAEIDYDELYSCIVENVSRRAVPDDNRVRDLATYRMTTAGALRAEGRCRDHFSPERLARWKSDLELFTGYGGAGILRDALEDRGYNGTPFEAAVAGAVADRLPLDWATLNLVPLFDVAMLLAMAGVVTAAFGWPVGLVFALYFFTNAADRWGIIGGSFFRYPWMVTLGLGFAALRRERWGRAGFWMALSALFNVFPAVFSASLVLRGLAGLVRGQAPAAKYRRFVGVAAITTVLGLGVGLLPARHLGNYTGWWHDMELHNVERFQGFGVGLKFPFTFRGAITADQDRVPERVRRMRFHQVRPWYRALAAVVLGMALLVALRTDDEVEAAGVLGFTLFFTLLGTVGYYFAAAAVLVLALHRRARDGPGAAFIAALFLCSVLAHVALYATLYYRFMYNIVISTTWSIWLVALLAWLVARTGGPRRRAA